MPLFGKSKEVQDLEQKLEKCEQEKAVLQQKLESATQQAKTAEEAQQAAVAARKAVPVICRGGDGASLGLKGMLPTKDRTTAFVLRGAPAFFPPSRLMWASTRRFTKVGR